MVAPLKNFLLVDLSYKLEVMGVSTQIGAILLRCCSCWLELAGRKVCCINEFLECVLYACEWDEPLNLRWLMPDASWHQQQNKKAHTQKPQFHILTFYKARTHQPELLPWHQWWLYQCLHQGWFGFHPHWQLHLLLALLKCMVSWGKVNNNKNKNNNNNNSCMCMPILLVLY